MTKQDYKLLASVLAKYNDYQIVQTIARELATTLKAQNPKFNERLWFPAVSARTHSTLVTDNF